MDHETGSEFRLEPSGLGRHDVAGVGDVYGKNGQKYLF